MKTFRIALALLLFATSIAWAQNLVPYGFAIEPTPYISGAGVANGPILFVDGTASAPGMAFASDPSTGWFRSSSGTTQYSSAGGAELLLGGVVRLHPSNALAWAPTSALASNDLMLVRDGANVLAQRNGTNNQLLRFYGTFTNATNYERLIIGVVGNAYYLLSENAGTGVARSLNIGTGTDNTLAFISNNVTRWTVDSPSGHLLAFADNTYDIGTSGATRPRTVYVATGFNLGTNATLRAGATTVGGSCGTAPTIAGNNSFGKVTTGTGAPTSCAVTFSSAWTNAPACSATNETTANLARATSTTTTVVLAGTFVAGDVLAYQCGGY